MLKIISLVLLSYLITNTAYAYIDPGTGLLIIQFFISVIAAIYLFFKSIKDKIKSFFYKKNNA